MPVFYLNDKNIFPPVSFAEKNGIIAVGGDLTPERLMKAYENGIFPWFSEGDPIIWWSPDPRFVLYPEDIKVSRSMNQEFRKGTFKITADLAFEQVIQECRKPRKHESGTWITDDIVKGYTALHKSGYAHSIEAWKDGHLAGGLYGVSLGGCFFGESMFTREKNGSKAAFITLARKLAELNFDIIDCQVYTAHLESLGAVEIPRREFTEILNISLTRETIAGDWSKNSLFDFSSNA